MGAVRSRSNLTVDDGLSVDQSVLAHDGSRDGSVVPNEGSVDQLNDEIATNEDVKRMLTSNQSMDHSVDLIHNEAHQIIDELHANLKELKDEDLPMTNNEVLPTVIEKEKQRQIDEIMDKTKHLFAETDEWFINEDGDIVLIYPQPNEDADAIGDNDDKELLTEMNEDVEVKVDDDNKTNLYLENAVQKDKEIVNEINDKNVEQNDQIEKEDEKAPLVEQNDDGGNGQETDVNDIEQHKTETFFNSFRIF